jgi:hypothetical protein
MLVLTPPELPDELEGLTLYLGWNPRHVIDGKNDMYPVYSAQGFQLCEIVVGWTFPAPAQILTNYVVLDIRIELRDDQQSADLDKIVKDKWEKLSNAARTRIMTGIIQNAAIRITNYFRAGATPPPDPPTEH